MAHATDTLAHLRRALHGEGPESSDFDLSPQFRPAGRVLRPAAVLMPLIDGPNGLSVLLTKRASGLKHHPGQIAFPGGKVDATDADARAAAPRRGRLGYSVQTMVRARSTRPLASSSDSTTRRKPTASTRS